MDFRTNPIEVVNLMAKNEEAISRLYQAYAERFPQKEAFWASLAADELVHANWIRALEAKVREGALGFNRDRFRIQPVRGFSNYLERELVNVRVPGMSLINALSVALYIEESILEHKYFEVVQTDAPELKKILNELAAGTKTHLGKVREEWEKQRASASP